MKIENQFSEIVQLIKQSRSNAYTSINVELINCYWQVGEHISKRISSAAWGDKTVEDLATYIQKNHPDLKNFNRRGLYRMKQFYETYCQSAIVSPAVTQLQAYDNQENTIVSAARTQLGSKGGNKHRQSGKMAVMDIRNTLLSKLTWTNHRAIFSRCKTEEERAFYLKICVQENFNTRELERQISAGLFERTALGNQKLSAVLRELKPNISNTFKENYVLEFLDLPAQHNEGDLQKALIGQMKSFILELGKDFLFIGEEYRIQVGNSDFSIDLLFFHRGLLSLVAFELKADKFRPEHLGQLNFYLEALDRDVKKEHENPSIGILLCKDQDMEVVKYALNRSLSPALVAAYQTQLPDKKILQQKLIEIYENKT